MILSEREARTKQCCKDSCGMYVEPPKAKYQARWCVGSGCMAWRWVAFSPAGKPELGCCGWVYGEEDEAAEPADAA